MKKTNRILLGAGIAIAAGFIIYAVRRRQFNRRLTRIADEGYETANDILFPGTKRGRKKFHYGPVLPG